jgi:hypothetical protein
MKCNSTIIESTLYSLSTADGDVLTGSYRLDTLYNHNLFTIDNIDEKKGEINGTFELRFIKTSGISGKDTVTFDKGIYRTKFTPQ